MKRLATILARALAGGLVLAATLAAAGDTLDRTVLPIPEPSPPRYHELDARNVEMPLRFEVKAPAGAPNVVIILIDDLGFGATSAFGGPITTPTLEGLAQSGLRYNNFHTAALCSPTRVALKAGRNHHTLNMGSITESATGFPGNTGQVPNSAAPLAEILRLNGYSTAAFGKWHETAVWETSVSGPYDRWPTHQGFDKFYGFIGAEANQYQPYLRDGVTQVELPNDPSYHLMTDMTDKAVAWIAFQKAMTPGKPFFVYFSTGAMHAPHHVSKYWRDRWVGKFDQGWDALRQETLTRQIAMGIVPPGTKLAPKPAWIKDWATLSEDQKKLYRRQVEVYAAYLEYTDHEIRRLLDAVEATGQADNTIVMFIAGDNGTSGEGSENGLFNEYTYLNGVPERLQDLLPLLDKWGGPETYPHMAAGWAMALDAPFAWMKQVASDFGGTRNGMVIRWPREITDRGTIRPQFGHVIDVAPTILEAIGLPEPRMVNGSPQIPMEGASMKYTFNDARAKDRHTTQYFEIFGNRAIYEDGWFARTVHKAPWENEASVPLQDDVWQLYDVRSDFSLANDLAAAKPVKLEQMKGLFMREAYKYHVLPIDDRFLARSNAAAVGRPDLMAGRTSLTLAGGMTGMMEATFLNVKNKSWTVEAQVAVPQGGANGAIIVQGGRFGGWALYMKDGAPAYDYNFLGLSRTTIAGGGALAPGNHVIKFQFAYDGTQPGDLGMGGTGSLYVDGAPVAQGRIPATQANCFSFDETADVGIDLGTPVVEAIGSEAASRFTGEIPRVTVTISPISAAADASAEEARRTALLRIQ